MLRRSASTPLRFATRCAPARRVVKPRVPFATLCSVLYGASLSSRQRPYHVAPFSSEASTRLSMTENEFMELADETLHEIQSWLDGIEELVEESDIMFSQGVLKIDLGQHGTWVINRQVPNRQLWWSSPIRYEYDPERGQWINTRDKGELMTLLRSEILEATGIEIYT
ncbi:hypothetical protein PsorP6_005609 [Peronosclerospora sorghi]|uniref:Uncharacterized protein n=1 Tax=Peronosclerospora sorghi TaxID=230839 RepID=A0ACC0W1W1_9STRA|nr:hypothetical protein PsorP6_005609 [Peronosclerospora sorghi]